MGVQDERRELAQIELFDLLKPEGEGRSGVDAILVLDGVEIPFELKTMTEKSVTTARDFGTNHIKKWRGKHYLISKFSKSGAAIEYTVYGGPIALEPWLKTKEEYIKPDYLLSAIVPEKLTLKEMYKIVGKKDIYTYEDAKKIQKQQYKKDQYVEMMDLTDGYSQKRMLQIIQDRCRYILERGSTLNNPHISLKVIQDWPRITDHHGKVLRKLVRDYLSKH